MVEQFVETCWDEDQLDTEVSPTAADHSSDSEIQVCRCYKNSVRKLFISFDFVCRFLGRVANVSLRARESMQGKRAVL